MINKTDDPIMGGHTARLTPSPLPPIAGWAWVEWADPALTCSMTGSGGHRYGWRRLSGPDAGKFFAPEAGPQELPKKVTRGSSENDKPRSSRRKL